MSMMIVTFNFFPIFKCLPFFFANDMGERFSHIVSATSIKQNIGKLRENTHVLSSVLH